MAITVEILIDDLKELESFPNKTRDKASAGKFLSDFEKLINGYSEYIEPEAKQIKDYLKSIIVEEEFDWNKQIYNLLSFIVHQKYQELTNNFVSLFNNCDKYFNEVHKTEPKLKIDKKLKDFHFYFDRNDFWFKQADFEHFKMTIKNVTGIDIIEGAEYSKREAIHFMVIYLDKINKLDKVEPLITNLAFQIV